MTKRNSLVIKSKDLAFNYVLAIDSEIEPWRAFAATWYNKQIGGRAGKRLALDKFLTSYLPSLGPAKLPLVFLLRNTKVPPITDLLHGTKPKGVTKVVNHLHDFINWVLEEGIAIEDDNGHKIGSSTFQVGKGYSDLKLSLPAMM